jgi:hypothetical protein
MITELKPPLQSLLLPQKREKSISEIQSYAKSRLKCLREITKKSSDKTIVARAEGGLTELVSLLVFLDSQ